MRKSVEELRKSTLRTLEMNFIYRSLKSKPEPKKEKRLRRERE
jgi:hypothetical protein